MQDKTPYAAGLIARTCSADTGYILRARARISRRGIEIRGHHRVTIDPMVHNLRAITAYKIVGFKPVGVMRKAERDPRGVWRDNLLMDILAEELEKLGRGADPASWHLVG